MDAVEFAIYECIGFVEKLGEVGNGIEESVGRDESFGIFGEDG